MAGDPKEADRVAQAIAGAARGGFALVSIDGPGGSGKSTLAAEVAERLSPDQVSVVQGDDFYRPMSPEQRLLLSPQEGYERYFDWQRLRDQVLSPLASGAAAQYQRYDWPAGELAPGELHQVSRSGVVIVEGVYTARPSWRGTTT